MKNIAINIILVLSPIFSIAQLILNAPNKLINGKKDGFWSERTIEDSLFSNGTSRLALDLHYNPKYLIAEGQYKDDEKTGIWRLYWIDQSLNEETGNIIYQKGQIKRIEEYRY